MMLTARIEPDYRITIPENLRASWQVGDEVVITTDNTGRLTLIPKARLLQILEQTAGMWADRTDVPADGVEYVATLRSGRRLHELGVTSDGDGD